MTDPKTYTVKSGDSLWIIAQKFGLNDPQLIVDHPDNKHLFEQGGRNLHRILPGDVLVIPALQCYAKNTETNKKVLYRLPSRKSYLRLEVRDVLGSAITEFKYEVRLGDQEFSGDQSTNGGIIEVPIPLTRDNKGNTAYWPQMSSGAALSPAQEFDYSKGYVKIFPDPGNDRKYQIWNVNLGLDPKTEISGIQQQLANELKFLGTIDRDANSKSSNDSTYLTSDEIKNVGGNELENKDLLALATAENYSPDYFPAVWHSMKYARMHELSEQRLESLLRKKESMSEDQAKDAINVQIDLRKRDVAYFQFCFNEWAVELSNLISIFDKNGGLLEAQFRAKQHTAVKEVIGDWVEDWKSKFDQIQSISELQDMKYDREDGINPEFDLHTVHYSTAQKEEDLRTHIVLPPVSSRVRFCYDDDPDTPIANSNVIYWRYGKDGRSIESGREDYYKNAGIMMPIGIGRTDEEGYLIQSGPFSSRFANGVASEENGKFSMYAGSKPGDEAYDGQQWMMPRAQSKAAFNNRLANNNSLHPHLQQSFDRINKDTPEFGTPAYDWRVMSISLHSHLTDIEEAKTYDELKESMLALKEKHYTIYEKMQLNTNCHLFNYYSSGSQDTWGFMVYPPDGGFFQTGDLAAIGNEGKYAYKGSVRPPNDQDKAIKLHCTLQEWERRLKIQNNILQDGLKAFAEHTKYHQENLISLGKMQDILDLYNKYPYEKQTTSHIVGKAELNANLKGLVEGIQGIYENPHKEKDKDLFEAKQRIDESSEKILNILKSPAFNEEFKLYQDARLNKEDSVSPYMDHDESWMSVYATISEALELLAGSPVASEAFDELLCGPVDAMALSEATKDDLAEGIGSFDEDRIDDIIHLESKGVSITQNRNSLITRSEDYAESESKEFDDTLISTIFKVLVDEDVQKVKGLLGTWVNNVPGPDSVLMVVLNSYGTYVTSQMTKNGAVNGYHIRLVAGIYRAFGLFSGENAVPKNSLISILRTSDHARASVKYLTIQKTLSSVNESIADKRSLIEELKSKKVSPGRKVQLNSRVKKLEEYIEKETAQSEKLKRNLQVRENRQAYFNKEGAVRYSAKLESNGDGYEEDFYKHADGRFARTYKSVLNVLSTAALIEDWAKFSELSDNPYVRPIDVALAWAKTMADTTYTAANVMLLLNRWAESEKLFGQTALLSKEGVDLLTKGADRIAIGVNVIVVFMTARDAYYTWDNKRDLEKLEVFLDVLGTTLTTIGYVASKEIGKKLLSRFALAALAPFLGPFLLIAGVVITVIQVGVALYRWLWELNYIKNRPTGYYFWKEFKDKVIKNSQRYDDEDFLADENSLETRHYRELRDIYKGDMFFSENEDGWGHLSWHAAIPLFLRWRHANYSVDELIDIVNDLCSVPESYVEITTDTSVPLSKVTTKKKLLNAKSFIRFYLHMEQRISEEKGLAFSNGNTYAEVMKQLEEVTYIPAGETDEVEELSKKPNVTRVISGGRISYDETIKMNTIWDHPHFKIPHSPKGIGED